MGIPANSGTFVGHLLRVAEVQLFFCLLSLLEADSSQNSGTIRGKAFSRRAAGQRGSHQCDSSATQGL